MTDDDVLVVDLDSLTIEDLEAIEELTGDNVEAFFKTFQQGGGLTAKNLRILGFIVNRQKNPDFTMEMAGKLKVVSKSDPTKGGANGTKRSPRSATSTPRTPSKP